MSLASHDHIDLVLNGHTIRGWSDDDPPYMLEFDATTEVKHSGNGGIYTLTHPRQSGTLRVRLMPHSPSVEWFIERWNERVQRDTDRVEGQIFTGTMKDVVKNIHYSLNGGFIVNVPAFTAAFNTYEAEMMFERIVPVVAGGRFATGVENSRAGGSGNPADPEFLNALGDGLFT